MAFGILGMPQEEVERFTASLIRAKTDITQTSLPAESHGQRNQAGYSPKATKSWTQLKLLGTHTFSKIKLFAPTNSFFKKVNIN